MVWITEILTSVNTIMPSAVIAGLSVFYFKTSVKFKSIKTDISEIKEQNQEILANYSAKERIKFVAVKAEKLVGITDNELLLFIKTCSTISLYFYENLYVNEFNGVKRDDVYKCSNRAIKEASQSLKVFSDQRFVDMFWDEFEDMAVGVQCRFIDIIEDKKINGKHERFLRAITDYLTDLFEMIIKRRTEYFLIEKHSLWDSIN